jgi:RHS repeat-associated protein
VRTYSAHTGQLTCEWKSLAGTLEVSSTCPATTPTLAGMKQVLHEGGKLKEFTDSKSSTRYEHTYHPSRKLSSARATAQAVGPLAQSYVIGYGFDGVGNLTSVAQTEVLPSSSSTTVVHQAVAASASETKDKLAFISYRQGPYASPPSTPAAGRTAYTYDLQGHLLTVTRDVGAGPVEVERLTYGPTGELVSRQVGGKFSFYVGEYMTVTASGQAGCVGTGCVPQPGTVAADYHVLLAGTRIASVSPSRTLFYYRSRQGTVVATSLAGGTVGAQYRYDPYGKLVVALGETAANASELGYTNALRLSGNLWYLKARVYDAELKTFLTADSVDRYRYAYVWGDPANLSDPSGLAPVAVIRDGQLDSYYDDGRGGNAAGGQRAVFAMGQIGEGGTGVSPPPVVAPSEVAATSEMIGLSNERPPDTDIEEASEEQQLDERSAASNERWRDLVAAQDAARGDPRFEPRVWEVTNAWSTFCNMAVVDQARALKAPSIVLTDSHGAPVLANEMYVRLAGSSNTRSPGLWIELSVTQARAFANDGRLVLAVGFNPAGPGHAVTVRPDNVPGDPVPSGNGPLYNDIGSQRAVVPNAIPASMQPRYFSPRVF